MNSLQQLFEVLLQLIRNNYTVTERDVLYAVELAKQMKAEQLLDLFKGEITSTHKGKPIRVKTIGQKKYVETIKKKDIVFRNRPSRDREDVFGCRWLSPDEEEKPPFSMPKWSST